MQKDTIQIKIKTFFFLSKTTIKFKGGSIPTRIRNYHRTAMPNLKKTFTKGTKEYLSLQSYILFISSVTAYFHAVSIENRLCVTEHKSIALKASLLGLRRLGILECLIGTTVPNAKLNMATDNLAHLANRKQPEAGQISSPQILIISTILSKNIWRSR